MSYNINIEKGQLIVDCGGTKARWAFVHDEKVSSFETIGHNPYVTSDTKAFQKSIFETIHIPVKHIGHIHFYGAGCNTPQMVDKVKKFLSSVWPGVRSSVYHDLLGAARASCGKKSGIVCILGTGSNSCYYDGDIIANNIPSLGYLLGDEGSGASLGKAFLRAYLRNELNPKVVKAFEANRKVISRELMMDLYQSDSKSKLLAEYAIFIWEHLDDPKIKEIVKTEFNRFFLDVLMKYDELEAVPIYFIGSVSYFYQDIIKEIAESYEITIGSIRRSPVEGLVEYHTQV